MKPKKLFLCGKCFNNLSQSLRLVMTENSMKKQPCDNCRKEYYGSFYIASDKEE